MRRILHGSNKVPVFEAVFDTRNLSTGSSASNQVTIPFYSSWLSNVVVEWGDGTIESFYPSSSLTHTYSVAGIYTIKIKGLRYALRFNNSGDRLKLLEIKNWGNLYLVRETFSGCANLTVTNTLGLPFTDNGIISNLFLNCTAITTINNINNWDWTKATQTNYIFQGWIS